MSTLSLRRPIVARASLALLGALALTALAAPRRARADAPRYTLTVKPTFANVEPGGRVVITAQIYRKGRATWSRHPWTWSATGGGFTEGKSTAVPRNIWIAPTRGGRYTINVTTHRAQQLNQWAVVTVDVKSKTRNLRIEPLAMTLSAGQTQALEVRIDGSYSPEELRWTRVGGGTIEGGATYRAGAVPGNYTLELTDSLTGQRAFCQVTITEARTLRVKPAVVRLRPGAEQTFEVEIPGKWNPDELIWSRVVGGYMIRWNRFRAGAKVGSYRLELTDTVTGQRAHVQVNIERPRARLRLEPAEARLRPGERVRFRVHGAEDRRRHDLYWSRVQGGFLIGRRTFLAGQTAGRFTLTLRDRRTGAEASAVVVVETTRVSRVTAEPRIARVAPGERVQLTWQAWDERNRRIPSFCSAKIVEGKGTLDPWGRLTAGYAPGTHIRVRVTEPRSGKADVIDVFVTRRRTQKGR